MHWSAGRIAVLAGQLKGALDHYGEAMHIRRDVLGDKHPKTLQSIGKMVSWWQIFLYKFGAIFSGQIIATLSQGHAKMWFSRGIHPQNALNSGLGIVVICADLFFLGGR